MVERQNCQADAKSGWLRYARFKRTRRYVWYEILGSFNIVWTIIMFLNFFFCWSMFKSCSTVLLRTRFKGLEEILLDVFWTDGYRLKRPAHELWGQNVSPGFKMVAAVVDTWRHTDTFRHIWYPDPWRCIDTWRHTRHAEKTHGHAGAPVSSLLSCICRLRLL